MSDYSATDYLLEISRTSDYKAVFRTLCLFEEHNLKAVDKEGNSAVRMIFETIFGIDYKKMEEESNMNRDIYQVLPYLTSSQFSDTLSIMNTTKEGH